MTKQIISRFYLITVDEKPIYVGFTNRPISTRFREHKRDKDLPDTATIQEIDELVYDFTWDVAITNKNAREVSNRETELIKKYHTQDSEYQKAIGGGQVWNEIKHFITINREDPFWQSMPEEVILETIENLKAKKGTLQKLVTNTKITSRLQSVVTITHTVRRLKSVINDTVISRRLKNVIIDTRTTKRLTSIIIHTNIDRRLQSVLHNTNTGIRLKDVVKHTRLK